MTYISTKQRIKSPDVIEGYDKFITLGDYYPLTYSEESRIRVQRYLEQNKYSVLSPSQARDLTPEELNQLNYLLLSLEAFYKQKNKFHTTPEFLIPKLMSLDGAKFLKRMKLKSFLTTHGAKMIEQPDWWDDIPSIYLSDIGEVYNHNYCFFWEAPDEQDYLISKTPLQPEDEYVERFKSVAERLISQGEDFEYVALEEILYRVTSSISMEQGISYPNYSLKSKHLHVSSVRSEGKRVLITTGPGTGRDAIINSVEDLNTIQYINENVRRFLEKNFSKYLLLKSSDINYKRYIRKCKKSSFYYCRDIKKEGLSKPKYLTKILLDCLYKRYPDCTAFQNTDFYLGPWYQGDTTGRGHGLGMANELTTLMQIVLFFATNEILGEEGAYISSTSALFLNDDAVIMFNKDETYDNVEDFIDTDFDLCRGLGILAQRDKSFLSDNCAVFCEMYYSKRSDIINDKESYKLREESIILRSGSILEAKFLLGNLKGSLETTENMLNAIHSKFKSEFHKNEIEWPITVGGLRPFKLLSVDLSLDIIKDLPNKEFILRAYEANKNKRLWKFNKYLKNFISPLEKSFPNLIDEEDKEILNKLGICSVYELACRFFRPTKEHCFQKSIRKLLRKRADIFNQTQPYIYDNFVENYVSSSLSNVKLEKRFIKKNIKVKLFTMNGFRDPYKVINPITSYLNLKNLADNLDCPRTAWGLFQTDADLTLEKSVFARNRTLNTLSLIDRFEEDIDSEILIFPENPEDIQEFMESYPKPFLAYGLVENGNELPIPYEKYRNKRLKDRKSVYGIYLSFDHIKLAQTMKWRELNYIIGIERLLNTQFGFDFWEKTMIGYRNRLKGAATPPSLRSSDSSDDDDGFDLPINIIAGFNDVKVTYVDSPPTPKKSRSSSQSSDESIDLEELMREAREESTIEPIIPPDVSLTIEQQVDIEIDEKESKNPFMKSYGVPEDGELDVYGTIGWIKWFVTQGPIEAVEFTDADEDLAYASEDMLAFKRGIHAGSESMAEHNKQLRARLDRSAEKSWISHYFIEYIETPEPEEEPLELDLFE